MKKWIFPVLLGLGLFSGLSFSAGCGEKPVDPVKANEGQGTSTEVPSRPGRNERDRLEAADQNR
jgi:hypothetical protein